MKKRRPRSLTDFVLPHKGNGYKPVLLTLGGVFVALIVLVGIEAAYVFDTRVVLTKTNFLASVLPSVLTDYTNEDRVQQGLSKLTPDALLAKAAQLKAEDMAAKGYFSHVSPDGKSPWYWLQQVGYPYSYAGENLAIDFNDSQEVQNAWMASPAHRANIVKPQYTRIGIGTAEGVYEGRTTTFVVQYFATPKKGAVMPGELNVASSTNARVLGAETSPAFSGFFQKIAASPLHTAAYVLTAIAGLFLVLLFFATVVHARIQFIEIIAGGLIVVLAALSLIAFNAMDAGATVPDTSHSVAATETP